MRFTWMCPNVAVTPDLSALPVFADERRCSNSRPEGPVLRERVASNVVGTSDLSALHVADGRRGRASLFQLRTLRPCPSRTESRRTSLTLPPVSADGLSVTTDGRSRCTTPGDYVPLLPFGE